MYIECPHCSAIFTTPTGLEQAQVRCGECGTVFETKQAESQLVPEESDQVFSDTTSIDTDKNDTQSNLIDDMDLTSSELDAIENIDISISEELDAELNKFGVDDLSTESSELEEQLDDDFMFESRALRKIGDTLELPVLDEMDYNDHSDDLRRNEFAATLEQTSEQERAQEALTDDIFEEFIATNQLIGEVTPESGITSKSTNVSIQDQDDLLPELDPGIELVDSPVLTDKLAATADDMLVLEAPPHSVFADLDIDEHDFSATDEISVPDLDDLPALQNDVDQIVDDLQGAAVNDNVIRDVPFPPEEPTVSQQEMLLDTQDDLHGLLDNAEPEEDLLQQTNFTPADTLINLRNAELEDDHRLPRTSKREVLYENRKLITAFSIVFGLSLLLMGQHLRHNRDTFKEYSFTRPVVKGVCAVSGCDVIPQRQPDQIEILEKSAYPHKTIENALTIKAKVVNLADESQPFPVLQVDIKNLAKQKVASRRFGPTEYLNKLPRRNGLMPANEPVFFEISIADPGRDGVDFDLTIIQ